MNKKLTLKTIILLVVLALTATTVLAADSPYLISSFWMADPLDPGHPAPDPSTPPETEVEGYWWRDTANQNAIAQHSEDEFTGQAINVWQSEDGADSVWVYSAQNAANVTALVSGNEYMVIGCGGASSTAQAARDALHAAAGIRSKYLRGVVVPSALMQHYQRCSYWTRNQPIPVYVGERYNAVLADYYRVAPEIKQRGVWIYGSNLTWGTDSILGVGSMKSYTLLGLGNLVPTTAVTAETTLSLGSLQVTLMPADGSVAPAGLWVHLPDQGILVAADTGKYLPDVAAINFPNPRVEDVIAGLERILQLAPQALVGGGQPILGQEAVAAAVTAQRNALQSIQTQTITKINQYYSVDEIAAMVALPADLAANPYNRELVSTVPQVVRSIYHAHMGWFGGETDELASSLTPTVKAQILADAYGGLDNLVAAARQAELDARDLPAAEQALYLAHAAYKLAPDDFNIQQVYAQALRKNAFMQTSAVVRNYYLSEASRFDAGFAFGLEDTPLAFTEEEFRWSYYNYSLGRCFSDLPWATLEQGYISSLPPAESGVLTLAGSPVSLGQWIQAGDLDGLVFTPAANWNGETSFNWRGNGTCNDIWSFIMTITIRPVSDPPVVAPLADLVVDEDAASTVIDLATAFTDGDGEPLTFTLENSNPALLTASLDGTTLTLDYLENQSGVATIAITASDPGGLSVADDFTVTVNPVNDAPWAAAQEVLVTAGIPRTVTLDYGDVETDQAGLQVAFSGPANGTLDASALPEVTYTAIAGFSGEDSFTYTVSDGELSAEATVTIQVVQTSISGRIFNDANASGSPDEGEAGLAGVTVQLIPLDGSPAIQVVTAEDGTYAFGSLLPGTYQVRQVLLPGYVQTTPDPADIDLAEGQALPGIDFGQVLSADLQVSMTYSVNSKKIIFAITVTNDGPADALNAALTDVLPDSLAFVSVITTQGTCGGGSTVNCDFGTIASGGSVTVTIQVNRVDTKIPVVNTATVASSVFDIDPTDNTAEVTIP